MKAVLTTLLLVFLTAAVVFLYFYAGKYNVAATEPHSELARWFLDKVQVNSVRTHAEGIQVPDRETPQEVMKGLSEYHEMCETCHGAPGVLSSEIGSGLNPAPPDLTESVEEFTRAELFWTIKNGIKMSGMPAFGPTHNDEKLWGIVAFLETLPETSAGDYQQMLESAGLTTDSQRQAKHSEKMETGPGGR